jgi:glucokinase
MTDQTMIHRPNPTDGPSVPAENARLHAPTSAPDGSSPAVGRGARVGVDIGGSKIAVLVVGADGEPCARRRSALESPDPDPAIAQIAAVIDASLSDAGLSRADVQAVGVGVPGRVDTRAGSVTFAVNLGWQQVPLGAHLEVVLGLPVVVENDVRAAAVGLHRRSAVGSADDLAYLSIGTGISAGVILGGRLHRGVRGVAGEVGHVVLDAHGPACACGLHGCFEALAAGPAIARAAREAVAAGRSTNLARIADPSAVDVFAAAAEGDEVALGIVADVGRWVARGVHALVLAYDVELVVIGGGVSRAGEPFLRAIEAGLAATRAASPFADELLGGTAVRLLPEDVEPGTWGAVALVENTSRRVAGPARGRTTVEEVVARETEA